MNTPPFLLAACLAFWGWQTGWLWLALPLGLALEATRFHRFRWDFTDTDFQRIWNICALLFAGAFILRLTNETTGVTGYAFFQWQPLIFAPLMLAQAHSARTLIPAATFSWLLRRWSGKRKDKEPGLQINVAYPYAALAVLCAGAANQRNPGFYLGVCVLALWAAWINRSRRFSAAACLITFALAATLGFLGHTVLTVAQGRMENQFAAWFSRWTRRSFDPVESRTSMGRIGSLKQSGRIVMRVRPEGGPFPSLLRQSTYDALHETSWASSSRKDNGREFAAVPSEEDLTTWQLATNLPAPGSVSIFLQFPGKRGLLAAPSGTTELENLPVGGLETNSVGVLRVTDAPGLLKFRALYGAAGRLDVPPNPKLDLAVPERERKAITNVLAEINAGALQGEARLVALAGFFQNKFRYETYVPGNARVFSKYDSPLARFLLLTRAGHCEYFASATVLILRQMGIPARYTTGFAVQEKSRWSQTYLVRDRHAHAWVTAWVNGAWREFDTTPSSWNAFEEKESSMFEPVGDLWAELLFQLARWRWLGDRELFGKVAPWLIGPLVLLLSWRIFAQRKRAGQTGGVGAVTAAPAAGADSEFYQIDARLAKLGLARRPHESWTDWLGRVEAADGVVPNAGQLPPLLELHCRYRFARHGVSATDRAALRQGAELWLAGARKATRAIDAKHRR